MKNIKKIVLTGGPCAGKTTAMSWIQNNLEKEGYKVLFVPEAATEVINVGIKPAEVGVEIFQRALLKLQIEKEKIYEEAAKRMDTDKILIVCDRGLLDSKAYMDEEEYNKIINDYGISFEDAKERYDAVFHLVTAAKGVKDFYNLDNEARTETIEEACALDDKTLNAWTGHSRLRVIDNSTDFSAKMNRLLEEIGKVLGLPEPYEIERKFLIKKPDLNKLINMPFCKKVNIVQTYLKSDENEEIRIRQRGISGSYTYTWTKKIPVDNTTRIEIERRLTKDEYLDLLTKQDTNTIQIIKDRYCLCYKGQYFEIDIYPHLLDEAICEIELRNKNQKIEFPPFLKIIDEVTNDKEFKNSEIAKRLIKTF